MRAQKVSDLLQDLRFAVRQLRRSPSFTVTAVVCLALGIGGNTAVFSFTNAIFQERPGIAAPARLVWLMVEWKEGLKWGAWSYPDYLDLRREVRVEADLVAETPQAFSVGVEGGSQRLWGALVSGNFFSTLGVEMLLGRGFEGPEGEVPGAAAVTVLSYGLWQRRLGGDPGVVGRTVTVNGLPFTVIGVAPRGYRSPNVGFAPELWVPITEHEVLASAGNRLDSRGWQWIAFVMGRLAPDTGPEGAQAAARAVMVRLAAIHPDSNTGKGVRVYRESEAALHPMVHGAFVSFLGALFAVVGLVLILASANVAGLLLARAASRRREMAVRLALGAGRGLLVRQLLVEGLLLALLACAVGVLLGVSLVRVLGVVQPRIDLPLDFSVPGLNVAVLAFTLAVSLVTGLAFGLVPALETTRLDLVSSLKGETSASHIGASGLRRGLVVAQVALSLVLLIGAGLALKSLRIAGNIRLGFDPDRQLLVPVDLGLLRYGPERGEALFGALRERVLALPDVEEAGYAVAVPLSVVNPQTPVLPRGYVLPPGANEPTIDYNFAATGYFEAMGTAVVRGRAFDDRDGKGSQAAVVNQAFVRRFWAGAEPIGKRVRAQGQDVEVVGVVEDGKYWSLGEEPRPYLYLPIGIQYRGERTLHVRTSGNPAALVSALRRVIQSLDPDLPVSGIETMRQHLRFSLFPTRLLAAALSSFATLALLLAGVGLYGVIAFWVSRATPEIGVRMALGAGPMDVLWLVVRRALPPVAAGLALGLAAALALARLASGLLYGVSPLEPGAYLRAVFILAGVAFLVSLLPARRAARVDPAVALRAE